MFCDALNALSAAIYSALKALALEPLNSFLLTSAEVDNAVLALDANPLIAFLAPYRPANHATIASGATIIISYFLPLFFLHLAIAPDAYALGNTLYDDFTLW